MIQNYQSNIFSTVWSCSFLFFFDCQCLCLFWSFYCRTFERTAIIWWSDMELQCSQDLPGTTLAVHLLKIIAHLWMFVNQSV